MAVCRMSEREAREASPARDRARDCAPPCERMFPLRPFDGPTTRPAGHMLGADEAAAFGEPTHAGGPVSCSTRSQRVNTILP